jgi:hypothetical protein
MPINLLSAGGGTTTLTTASSASNFTVTIPAETGTVITTAPGTSSNVLTSNGTAWTSVAPAAPASLSTASGSAPSYSARAWVNFNGTSTVSIRASGNVSSITDNGTGDYTVNFTTAMPDANYTVVTNARSAGSALTGTPAYDAINTTAAIKMFTFSTPSGSQVDPTYVLFSCFR